MPQVPLLPRQQSAHFFLAKATLKHHLLSLCPLFFDEFLQHILLQEWALLQVAGMIFMYSSGGLGSVSSNGRGPT